MKFLRMILKLPALLMLLLFSLLQWIGIFLTGLAGGILGLLSFLFALAAGASFLLGLSSGTVAFRLLAIGFVLFILFHILLVSKLDRTDDSFMRTVALAACFGVWITYMTEGYKKFFRLYLVMFIAYHIRELLMKKKE